MVAREYGVSQGWISRLVARFHSEGEAAFEPRSRLPHTSPPGLRAYALLHGICAQAVDDKLLGENPCSIKGAMTTTRAREPVILEVDEVAALVGAIRPERLRALVLVSAWCGLRWGGEGDRTAPQGRQRGRQPALRGPWRHPPWRLPHRHAQERQAPRGGGAPARPPRAQAHLAAHVGPGPEALLFPPARGGCHLNDQVFREYFVAACNEIGREGMRVHDLRHFAGTQTARVGNLVETWAGWGTPPRRRRCSTSSGCPAATPRSPRRCPSWSEESGPRPSLRGPVS